MIQDNKDAALELAKGCGFCDPDDDWPVPVKVCSLDNLQAFYNSARKPLIREVATVMLMVADGDEQITELQQQLLATQEAYQRVREALLVAEEYLPVTGDAIVKSDLGHIAQALANPPSMEALEQDRAKRKLEEESAELTEKLKKVENAKFGEREAYFNSGFKHASSEISHKLDYAYNKGNQDWRDDMRTRICCIYDDIVAGNLDSVGRIRKELEELIATPGQA